MELRPITLPLGGDRTIRAVLGVPRTTTMAAILVLAHGANNNMDYPLIAGLHEKLARQGLVTVRFNFPYSEEGRQRPDPDATLEGVYRLVLEYVAELDEFKGLELYLGGKSWGPAWPPNWWPRRWGPAAWSFWVTLCTHPAEPEQLHDEPLYLLPCPALFIEGARDPFCRLDLLGQVWARCRCAPTCI